MNRAIAGSFPIRDKDRPCVTMSVARRGLSGHDPAPDEVDQMTSDEAAPLPAAFSVALERLRLEGAIFLRAEYRDPWSYLSLSGPETAAILRPGTDRVVLFHLVAAGTCWVEVDGEVRHWASAGDVIVLPYGEQHRMGGVGDATSVPLSSIMESPPWTRMPIIRHGEPDGELTNVVCGFLHSDDVLFEPTLRVFPPVFVVRPRNDATAGWVSANVEYALTQADGSPLGPDAVPTRLPELLLVEILRQHLATAPALDHGWLAALHDPVLQPALSAIHTAPAERWSVTTLARRAAVSRSALDAHFRRVLGISPIRYLTEWRMHLARDLLASTDLGVASVARRVGYDAEEAFSRAFKRHSGAAPTQWRGRHHLRNAPGADGMASAAADVGPR
jgi:AraC-like DNA-binding protein